MPKRSKGITARVAATPRKIKRKMSTIITPLNVRERVVYSVLILGFISLLAAPRIVADVGDEGSIFAVAPTQCSSGPEWQYPEHTTGQQSVRTSPTRDDITTENAAVSTGTAGVITCGGYSPILEHSRLNHGVRVVLKAVNQAPQEIDVVSDSSSAETISATLQDGAILNERLDDRGELLEPNAYAPDASIVSTDAFLQLSMSNDGGGSWHTLHTFGTELTATETTVYDIALPVELISSSEDLSFRLATVADSNSITVFAESLAWTYEAGPQREVSAHLINPVDNSPRGEAKPAISDPADLQFEVGIKDPNDGIWQGLRSKATETVGDRSLPLSVEATIYDNDGYEVARQTVEGDFIKSDTSNRHIWTVDAGIVPQSLDPGEYSIELSLDDGSGTTQTVTQDFVWGVLALNFDKSSYRPDETAQIQMAVLDEQGRTICDADLRLVITTPSRSFTLSTENDSIQVTETCPEYGAQIDPDYIAQQVLEETGAYAFELEANTQNGSYTVYSSLDVIDDPSFEVSRVGPTRVFPILEYPMRLQVFSKDGYRGRVHEVVPVDFDIAPDNNSQTYNEISIVGNQQIITWDVDIPAGQSVALGYIFDAPDISPEFYTLGPLVVGEINSPEFSEQRSWQIAGDAVGNLIVFYSGTGAMPAGWSCVSCTTGNDFFQRFAKGAATYGGNAGAATHTHTAAASAAASTLATTEPRSGNAVSGVAHTHTANVTIDPSNNLPAYRQLRLIRYDTTGMPATLPAGTVGVFDTTSLPAGWTSYGVQTGNYIRGENTVGSTGGSNTHTTSFTGSLLAASTATDQASRGGGTQTDGASTGHTHTFSGTSASASNEPPYLEMVLATNASAQPVPLGFVGIWNADAPVGWDDYSGSGKPLNGRYIKPAATYGATGGSATHTHTNTTGIVSTQPSATSSARSGTAGASNVHTHNVSVTGYSTLNHEPPHFNAYFAKYNPVTKYEQSAYRFYENDVSTDVGAPIDTQDTAITTPTQGTPFRLRMNLHISEVALSSSGENFKLQYAVQSGTCDPTFTGETFFDVGTASGDIRYYDNSGISDAAAATVNANDPTHGADTVNIQTYEETNNFTNAQSGIGIGEDGLWDFALIDVNAPSETTYCLRIVKSDGTPLDTYTAIPELTTPPPPPKMILLYDGASIPSGWTCISCSGGGEAFQRMIRGAATYGGTGGSATHSHTASGAVSATGTAATSEDQGGATVSTPTHTHTYSPIISSESNLPAYRQLQIIQFNGGTPSTIPNGAIGLFTTTTMPTDFTRYSAQDGNFTYGENTIGTTGGNNSDSHSITGNTSSANSPTTASPRTNGSTAPRATNSHDHTVSGNTGSVDKQPPFIEMVLGQATTDTSIPGGLISMWTDNPGGTWTCVSCTGGDDLYQRFFKAANGYGTTGGASTHTHSDVTGIASGAANQTIDGRSGSVGDEAVHTHSIDVTGFSTENHLPPYINMIFYQSPTNNTAPDNPSSLGQEKTNTDAISVGNWTNESSVVFTAQVSDSDNPDSVALCVEIQPLGTPFTNSETSCGTGASYTGSPVAASVTLSSLTDGEEYHWQARTKDSLGAYSGWVSFGANAESARDFAIDSSPPTGTVYDGSSVGVDVEYNSGALDTLEANWNIDSSSSGLVGYEYSIGTVAGATDVKAWTSVGTSTSFSDSSLTLTTSQPYFVNIRTTDNAGSESVISSDGQFVAPTLNFSLSGSALDLGNLNPGNNYTATGNTTITTSTNAYNGYVVRGYATGVLTNGTDNVSMFDGGTYVSPDEWLVGDFGFGYTSSDTDVQGSNKFGGAPCAGGGNPPCYAPWSLSAPGDIIADHTSTVSGTPIVNESFIITHRVTVPNVTAIGEFTTTIIYNITARF